MPFRIFQSEARSILSPASGYLLAAGFTHSLTPARNCTFGCSYCYVPTMRVYAGLRPDDWKHWGHHTTFKTNAAELLAKSLRPGQVIYCSPLTDPYQPAEATEGLMPALLETLAASPRQPAAFVIQTRGPLILRDIPLLLEAAKRTRLRVSFSVTTNREDVRKIFEPHCASIKERWQTIRALRSAGITVFATIAPILPCDPEPLMECALAETAGAIVADSLHVRETKRSGATTREAAIQICHRHGWDEWLEPSFQKGILSEMSRLAAARHRTFAYGPPGFSLLGT